MRKYVFHLDDKILAWIIFRLIYYALRIGFVFFSDSSNCPSTFFFESLPNASFIYRKFPLFYVALLGCLLFYIFSALNGGHSTFSMSSNTRLKDTFSAQEFSSAESSFALCRAVAVQFSFLHIFCRNFPLFYVALLLHMSS